MRKIIVIILIGIIFTSIHADTEQQFQIGMKKVGLTEIITTDGVKHTGRILYVRDSLLLFWETTSSFKSDFLDKYGMIYDYSDIERIRIKSRNGASAGFSIGTCVGVSSGVAYGDRVYQREASSCLRLPLEYYLIKYACMFGGSGAVIGGIIGSIFDKEGYDIKGDYNLYRKILPVINQHAVFPYYLTVELHNFIQEQKR